ncbi:hypothetical protein [Streptomyces litchfieldiae]|uniref:Lipoprotein n=1 Tax=Streptomyces litchfieldiae TaxID=3075543 RepID=A0ABU2N3X7_9ACTN|nr:hypothetical protein [Streptomyces sp. DSM 44938]MDT0347768.1 hypothetical protein [Streptomyces sp. DSM 44938]
MATALLLTSCGGGDDDETDEIQGVETGEETTEEPTEEPAETPTEEAEGRPTVDFGDDYRNVYEDTTTDDATVDAIIRDLQGFQDAQDEAIVSFQSNRPALRYYIAGAALDRTIRMLDDIYEGGLSSGGTSRYYRFDVTVLEDQEGAATFSFCRDYTEVYTIDFASGEIVEEADGQALPDLYSGRLEQNADGVWQTVDYGFTEGAPECQ